MSPDLQPTASSLRSKYAFLFNALGELYDLHYGSRPSTKFEEIVGASKRLSADALLSEYQSTNLSQLFDLYPTLLPTHTNFEMQKNPQKEQLRLKRLDALIGLIIADICETIAELLEESKEHSIAQLISELQNSCD